jgi:cytochrome c-type biogenesis protein CcmH
MHRRKKPRVLIGALGVALAVSFAALAVPQNTEKTAHEIERLLIAPCCWSQPVAQHYSEAADQIRKEVRELLAAGKSKQEILDYYVSRYGERILASPRPRGFNLLAYVLPAVFLLSGACVVVLYLKKQTMRSADQSSSTRAEPLLDERYASRVERELRELQ